MKRLSYALLAALLAMMMCSCALADTGINLQNVIVGNQGVNLVVKADDGRYLQPSDFEVSFDAINVDAQSVNAYERSGYVTTHIYIVDVSTMSNNSANRMTDIQNTLNQLIDSIPAGDQAAIVTTGMKASGISLTDNQSLLHATVESIQFDKTLNGLDQTIREVCGYLETYDGVGARTSIVILSSGENETLNTVVLSELGELIIKSKATVYTIAFKMYTPNESALSGYGLLARKSEGGIVLEAEYVPKAKPMETEDIAELVDAISENEKLFCVVNVPLIENMSPFSSITLKLVSGNLTYSDTYALTEEQAAQVKEALERLKSEELPPQEPLETTMEFLRKNVIIIAGGVIIVVLVIVLLVVLIKRKKSESKEPISEDGIEVSDPEKTVIDDLDKTEPVSGIVVQFTPLSHGDIIVRNVPAPLTDMIQIGRRDDQCQIVIASHQSEEDIKTVSRIHAKLTQHGDSVLIENLSQNGTKVNNTKITRPMMLQQNDVITLGAVSFRISWYKE